MFPLQRSNELLIEFSSRPHQQLHKISEDLILDGHASLDVTNYSDKKLGSRRTRKLFFGSDKDNSHGNSNNECKQKKKKIIHREIERQRRQEMATLYTSLRSLLPLEYIKGKRSMSDHMNEAVNYINQLQKNIKDLSARRDELKRLSNSNPENHESKQHTSRCSFSVHENNGGVGIEVTSGFREERLPLPKLLELVLEEGLEIVTCLSTQVDGRLLHSVQCEVNNSDRVDLAVLRRKVAKVVPSFRCSD